MNPRVTLTDTIDTHQHLWDPTQLHLPWLASAPDLNRCFSSQDYREAIEGHSVPTAIYMEVDAARAERHKEIELITRVCEKAENPTSAMVIPGSPEDEGLEDYIRSFGATDRILGVREVLHVESSPGGRCLEPEFKRGIRLLGDLNLNFDVCIRPRELSDVTALADSCPGTRLILDHCGNANPRFVNSPSEPPGSPETDAFWHSRGQWMDDLAALARRENVCCKISGIIEPLERGSWTSDDLADTVNHCLDSFGPDRVVFGSNWPVCNLGGDLNQWILALTKIISGRSPEERAKLLHANARDIYRLPR